MVEAGRAVCEAVTIPVCMYARKCLHVRVCNVICVGVGVYMYAFVSGNAHKVYMLIFVYVHVHIRVLVHKYMQTYTDTYIHAYAQPDHHDCFGAGHW